MSASVSQWVMGTVPSQDALPQYQVAVHFGLPGKALPVHRQRVGREWGLHEYANMPTPIEEQLSMSARISSYGYSANCLSPMSSGNPHITFKF